MNAFDAAVYVLVAVAVVTGFNAELVRSTATILGYRCAMPVAVAATSRVSPALVGKSAVPWSQNPSVFFGIFLVAGIIFGALLRLAVNETVGPSVGMADRLAGSILGAVRIFLVAVTMVLIFDRLIPSDRQPAFLSDSRLRPILSMAGQKGLKSLPPDVAAYIDELKQERRM